MNSANFALVTWCVSIQKSIDCDVVDRPFLGVVTVRTHRVRLARDPAEIVGHVPPVKTVFQSFLMLTTVQFCCAAISNACSAPAV